MIKSIFKACTPLPILERIAGRTRRVFALGTPKSGTTSIAGMFAEHCRAGHEPNRPATVNAMHDHFTGVIGDRQLRDSYRRRDKQLLLSVESNCFLAYRPDLLYETFPDASYIVTIREPLSWLESMLDNNLNFPSTKTPTMTQWHKVLFSTAKSPVTENDNRLVEMGLYPLRCYLEYWERTYRRCLSSLATTKCICIGTNQISQRSAEIGAFIDFDLSGIAASRTHKNQTAERHNVVQRLDRNAVEDNIREICKPLIDEFNLHKLWE